MLRSLLATISTAALLLAGLAPSAAADVPTPGCTKSVVVEVHYSCSGADIDLSLLQKEATQLYVVNGQIRDWAALRDFPQLNVLSVEGATNADVAGVTNAPPSLAFLSLRGVAINDLSPLSGLDLDCFTLKCDNELYLDVPGVTDLRPLSGLNADGCAPDKCVKRVTISAPAVTDFSPLGSIGDLKRLLVLAGQNNRERHVVNSTFALPRIVGLNGSLVTPTADSDMQHTFTDKLTARASLYLPGETDGIRWSLESTLASTALAASGATVSSDVQRTYVVTLPASRGDFSGDGKVDILARDSSGILWLYSGNGKGGWLPRVRIGSGWQVMSAIVAPGDLNSDGKPDVLARDTSGVLWFYPGNGKSGFLARARLGSGWNAMGVFVGPGDFTVDGKPDILARDAAGVLWCYPGNGNGGFLPRTRIGSGWNAMSALVAGQSMNDFNADVFARDTSGALWHYAGTGKGGWYPRYKVGSGWNAMTAMAGPGDLNGDGNWDVLARDSSGNLWLYPGTGGFGLKPRVKVGGGWNVMKAIV